ncbi:hypothetical protein INT47_012356 [Mucor saturninus]|uniref:Uncharacterized protein n=1 Tax=Mucor saturninus TaxID=64648 RepID=A0A8H7UYL5_9FUNG|nr:hypothetical protein INT47_012356 [Mucor saturninus]
MNEITEQDINDKDLLIQPLLSEFSNDVKINDGFEQTLENENVKHENPGKNALLNEFDWDSISVVENAAEDHEENYLTDFPIPSFEETVGSSEAVVSIKEPFGKEFPGSKKFADKQPAKYEIQEFCKSQNKPFETLRNDKVYLKLVCKLFGEYRNTRGEEISNNRQMYNVYRKLEADDQEFAIKMMQNGSTPSVVLEMLRTRDVCNINVIDLTNT